MLWWTTYFDVRLKKRVYAVLISRLRQLQGRYEELAAVGRK